MDENRFNIWEAQKNQKKKLTRKTQRKSKNNLDIETKIGIATSIMNTT